METEKILSKTIVCLDVPTRWDTKYKMLDGAEKFENAFQLMEEYDEEYLPHFGDDDGNDMNPIGPPNHFDWEKVRALSKFLKLFYKATLRFSGSLFVTSNAYFHELVLIQHHLRALCGNGENPLLKDMAKNMKTKYDKYWGRVDRTNLMLFVAVVLDTRYKLKYVKFWFKQFYDREQVDDMVAKVRDALDRLYGHYATKASSGAVNEQPSYKLHSSLFMVDIDVPNHLMMLNSIYKLHLEEEDSYKANQRWIIIYWIVAKI